MKNWGILVLMVTLSLTYALPLSAGEKIVAGWVEKVRIYPGNLLLEAKLDSGAETSSLHAARLQTFKKDGQQWVRFEMDRGQGEKLVLERPLLRTVRIKRHFGRAQYRPVIRLGVCLGKIYRETEVNLVDRTGFQYRMLIGRKFLGDQVVIDPGLTHQLEPQCRQPDLE